MAQVNFLSDINLSNNQLLNVKLQNLATPPTTTGWTGINLGWTYWDTTDLKAYSWNGDSWTSLSYIAPDHTGDVTSMGDGATTIAANAVTNSKLSPMAAHTFKGNNTGAIANAVDLTATQLTAELDVFSSTLKGITPASGGGMVNYLRADGNWAAPGDMLLSGVQTVGGIKTFLDTKFALRNVANTFSASFVNSITANRVYTLPDLAGTLALTSQIVATNLGYTAALANGTVTNSNGTSATLPLANTTNAGLLAPADFIKLASGVPLKDDYTAFSILAANTSATPVALTVGTNTVIGRVAGNIQAIAIDSDLSTVSASNDTVPSSKAVRTAIDLAVTSGMVNKGAYNASTNSPDLDTATSIAVKNGWMYTVSVAGTFFTQIVQVGDVVICNVDKAATLTVEADWTVLNKNIPDIVAASETAPGTIEIATQAEVIAATDDTRAITPLKLRTELDGTNRVYVAPSFGNASLTSFAFTHGLAGGSLYPTVVITDTVSNEVVYTKVAITSSTVVTVSFNVAPTANQYTVVIKK